MTMMHGLYLEDKEYNDYHREYQSKDHKDRFVLHSLYLNARSAEGVGELLTAHSPLYGYLIVSDLDITGMKYYITEAD